MAEPLSSFISITIVEVVSLSQVMSSICVSFWNNPSYQDDPKALLHWRITTSRTSLLGVYSHCPPNGLKIIGHSLYEISSTIIWQIQGCHLHQGWLTITVFVGPPRSQLLSLLAPEAHLTPVSFRGSSHCRWFSHNDSLLNTIVL